MAGVNIQSNDRFAALGFQRLSLGSRHCADQPPALATSRFSGPMALEPFGFTKRTDPEQAAHAPCINQQMQRLLEFQGQFGQAFEGEQIGSVVAWVATVTEALQLMQLRRPEPAGSS